MWPFEGANIECDARLATSSQSASAPARPQDCGDVSHRHVSELRLDRALEPRKPRLPPGLLIKPRKDLLFEAGLFGRRGDDGAGAAREAEARGPLRCGGGSRRNHLLRDVTCALGQMPGQVVRVRLNAEASP